VVALAAANTVGVVLFGALYAVAGAELMSQAVFLACLLVLFVLVTTVWIRTEARHRQLEPLRRAGRAAGALVLAIIAIPILVLMPLFWLDTQIPPEAGLRRLLAPIMTLTLLSLVLTALTNLTGLVVIVARALLGRCAGGR
jgi:phosphatidylglycerophosphate synthase